MAEKAKSSLILHVGARHVERAELANVPLPEATRTWHPVSHLEVIQTVERCLKDAGFQIHSEKLGLLRGDGRMFAVMNLMTTLATGVSLAVGIRNSLDKSLPLGFCAGSSVFVCDNLAFRAELSVARKHTVHGRVRFQEAIARAVGQLAAFREAEASRVVRLQETQFDDRDAESFMLRAFEKGIVSHRVLPGVIAEWRSPSFPEFATAMNAWRLLNAFTTLMADRQKSNPQVHAALTMQLGGLFDQALGIEPFVISNDEVRTDEAAS